MHKFRQKALRHRDSPIFRVLERPRTGFWPRSGISLPCPALITTSVMVVVEHVTAQAHVIAGNHYPVARLETLDHEAPPMIG